MQERRSQPTLFHAAQAYPNANLCTALRSEAERLPLPLVGMGVLELAPLSLHEQLLEFAEPVIAQGYQTLQLVPLFLLPGVHVMEDIPAEVAIAQQQLGQRLTIQITPHLGSHPHLVQLFMAFDLPGYARIVVAHGSRRPGGNDPVEALATQQGASPAYWAMEPTVETQILTLINKGCQRIVIAPYFLFAGSITDAIARQVDALQAQFPAVQFCWMQPLGPTPAVAQLILELINL